MNYPHPKDVQQHELWRKVSPTRYQTSPPFKPPSNPNPTLVSEPVSHRQPQSKYTYGIKQLEEARHRSPSYTDPNQLSKLTTQINQFQLQNAKLLEQNKNLTSNYNRLVDQNRDYRSQIQFFRTEFNKLRNHINSTQSIRQEVVKVKKALEEQKSKTQKYINESNKLVQEIKSIKAVLDAERMSFANIQKQNNQIKKLLEIQRKEKEEKTLIINQSRIMFEDQMRVLESIRGMEQNIKLLDQQIEGCSRQIEMVNTASNQPLINREQQEIIKKLQQELDSLRRIQSLQDVSVGGMSINDINSDPIIRNLKIIFEQQNTMLLRQLNEKESKLQELTNRLESLTLGDDSQQDIQNI